MRRFSVLAAASVAALLATPAYAQHTPASAQQFVQEFYTWYTSNGSSWIDVYRYRRNYVGAQLRRQMQAEMNCEEGMICEFDADPFLNSQDPCSRYTAQRPASVGARTRVRVRGDCGQTVTVELGRSGRTWQILQVL